jgi:hypothetical protein
MQRVEAICCEKFRRPCRESLRIYSRPRAYLESRRTTRRSCCFEVWFEMETAAPGDARGR